MKSFAHALWLLAVLVGGLTARAEDWSAALARMPLGTNVTWLTRTNCAEVLFQALPVDATVKAIVFLPGATDELYFFHRVNARLTNAAPTLLDAVQALTNQSPLRVVFHAPLLLIHSEEDVLELDVKVEHPATVEKLKASVIAGHQEFLDRDWKVVRDHHLRKMSAKISPLNRFSVTRHFYRHTYAGWNLTAWETLEATALAGKTRFTVRKNHVEFDLDERIGRVPRLESFPN
jgi:hypothetical protein